MFYPNSKRCDVFKSIPKELKVQERIILKLWPSQLKTCTKLSNLLGISVFVGNYLLAFQFIILSQKQLQIDYVKKHFSVILTNI